MPVRKLPAVRLRLLQMRFVRLLLFLLLPYPLFAQLTSQGGETTITFTPPVATLAVNKPALQFSSPGINTFLLTVNPTVAARVYVTNETANACLSTFNVSMAVTASAGVTSFNNTLQSWQSVALVNTAGQYATVAGLDIPALGTVSISSTAISGGTLAVQVVNSTGGCATTSIDITVELTAVSVTSPLISTGIGGIFGGLTAQVQGIIPSGTNGTPVFPVIGGALQPALNANINALGVDNKGLGFGPIQQNGFTGISGITPSPTPSASGEYALAFIFDGGNGISTTLQAPYTCIESGACNDGTRPNPASVLLSSNSFNPINFSIVNANVGIQPFAYWLLFSKAPTVRQHNTSNNITSASTGINTLAGSTLVLSLSCSTFACSQGPTDTQGLTWRLVGTAGPGLSGSGTQQANIYVAGPTTAAAETVTFNSSAGTMNGSSLLELSNITSSALNQASTPLQVDANKVLATGGNLPGVTDPCFTTALKKSVPVNIVTATTTQLIPLVAGQAIYVCGASLTIAPSGTSADSATFEYGTGASCGTGTTALTGAFGAGDLTTTTGLLPINLPSEGTDLTAPSGNALCLLSAGTTVNIQGVLTYVQQ
jgi:hypothetical protein